MSMVTNGSPKPVVVGSIPTTSAMKVYKTEKTSKNSGNKHIRVLFATNKEELKLLKGVLEQTTFHFPKNVTELEPSYNRLKNMNRAVFEGLKLLEE